VEWDIKKIVVYILPPWTSQISVTSLPSLYGSINFVRSLLLASYITGFWGGTGTKKIVCWVQPDYEWWKKIAKNLAVRTTFCSQPEIIAKRLRVEFFSLFLAQNVLKMSWIISDKIFHFLTYNCKINFEIPCWWVSKIYATSVHAFVAEFDIVNKQLRRMRRCAEKCSTAKSSWWWP
jgi:hypothetical protein